MSETKDGGARRLPYDDNGRFVPLACQDQNCGGGKLVLEDPEHGVWECDGMVDPNDPSKELEVCTYSHFDGEPWPWRRRAERERTR